jgi:hypothetical protein
MTLKLSKKLYMDVKGSGALWAYDTSTIRHISNYRLLTTGNFTNWTLHEHNKHE